MRWNVALSLGFALAACQRTEPSAGVVPKTGTSLPKPLLGEYSERALKDEQQGTEHRLSRDLWNQQDPDAQSPINLKLREQLALRPNAWAALYRYTHSSTRETILFRVDFYLENADTLWVCRHPQIADDPIAAAAGDTADLEGQGCFGAPWRSLKRKRAAP